MKDKIAKYTCYLLQGHFLPDMQNLTALLPDMQNPVTDCYTSKFIELQILFQIKTPLIFDDIS